MILKVRTGIIFQQLSHLVGPCGKQQPSRQLRQRAMRKPLRQRGAVICHAAGLVANGHCLGVAGLSGGGKSTLILSMLGKEGVEYLTNDRLLLETTGDSGTILAHGVPKLPRVNPGSILNNPVLRPMLADDRAAELAAMPRAVVGTGEKDVDVATLYGPDKCGPRQARRFHGFELKSDSAAPTAVREIYLEIRLDILGAVMKSPGPFIIPDGRFLSDGAVETDSYLEMLKASHLWCRAASIFPSSPKELNRRAEGGMVRNF